MLVSCFERSESRALLKKRGIQVSSSSESSLSLLEKSSQSFRVFVIILTPYTLMDLGQGRDYMLLKKLCFFTNVCQKTDV